VIRYILFDLDDTLYPASSGIMEMVRERIGQFMIERVGLPAEEVPRIRQEYLRRYGTTLRGLQTHHQVDPEDYLAYVHDVPLEQYIRPNPELDCMLERIPVEKVIFTNASEEHARKVLRVLGIERHFTRVFDIRRLNWLCKPDPGAYLQVLAGLGARPEECLLVDDSIPNVASAKVLGMPAILVGPGPCDVADRVIGDLLYLADVIGEMIGHDR
jgi:putative hydrolase of the HAD superfamily